MPPEIRRLPPLSDLFVPGHDPHDLKLGAVARPVESLAELPSCRFAILGFRSDEGIVRNSGRPGAALGPQQIRRYLYRLNATDARLGLELGRRHPIADLGDVEVRPGSLAAAQVELGRLVGECLRVGVTPIVLGGGHTTSYGHFLGYVEAGRDVAIVNLDAHLDVREVGAAGPTSGTPFRQALEHRSGRLGARYHCVGAMAHANSPDYVTWLRRRGGTIEWFEDIVAGGPAEAFCMRIGQHPGIAVMASLDMDCVSSAFAPGTSAASPLGFTALQFLEVATLCGESAAVTSFDVCEVSPPLDVDDRTSRLGALAVLRFLQARTRLLDRNGGGGGA